MPRKRRSPAPAPGPPSAEPAPVAVAAQTVHAHIAPDIRPLAVPIGDLRPDPRNPRVHDEANLAAIAASLREFGQLKPLVAHRATHVIEAGNGILAAAGQLGWTHLAVVWVEHDATAAAGFAIADNRTAELATWDQAHLDALLGEVETGLAGLYADLQLTALRTPPPDSAEADSNAAPADAVPDSYQIIVDCRDESDQRELYEQLKAAGRACRLLTM